MRAGTEMDLDRTLDNTPTPNDFATYDRGGMWAMKSYKVPHQPHWLSLANGVSKGPKVNVLTEHALSKKYIPAPNQYIKCLDWAKESQKNNQNLQKFLKADRITATEQILSRRKLREPGPGSYKPKPQEKITVLPLPPKSAQLMMLDEAIYRGRSTPGNKYNLNYSQTRPKSACAYQTPATRVKGQKCKDSRMNINVKKSKDPCLGLYKNLESEEKTQTRKKIHQFSKEPKKSFIDIAIKHKKQIPGAGKYI